MRPPILSDIQSIYMLGKQGRNTSFGKTTAAWARSKMYHKLNQYLICNHPNNISMHSNLTLLFYF